jgi:molecular chaperone GrpE
MTKKEHKAKEKKTQIEDKVELQEFEETKRQLARALADYQNLQRRVDEEKSVIGKFAAQYLLLQLLPIAENLSQATEHAPEEEKKSSWFTAVSISVNQLKELLKKEGSEEINPQNGQFDPNEHEAVDVIEGQEDNKVVRVMQKGYMLHGKVIQAARVQVSKKVV